MTSATLPLRVTLLDTWTETDLTLSPTTLVADLKQAALERAGIKRPASDYEVKYRGARLDEGGRTLADAGVPPNGELIVLLRRRVPAR